MKQPVTGSVLICGNIAFIVDFNCLFKYKSNVDHFSFKRAKKSRYLHKNNTT